MLKELYRFVSPRYQHLFLESKVNFKPRYGHGQPPHQPLYDLIDQRRESYRELLAAFLLANPGKYETLLPNYFISQDPELSRVLAPLWQQPALQGVETHGGSYWLRVN